MTNQKHFDVVAAVVEIEGQILCMQRGKSKYAYTSEKWEFPGGKIEVGESPQEALIRELQEEMDYAVRPIRRLAKVEHAYPDFSISLDVWLCEADTREFRQKEHINHRWFKAEELDTLDFAGADMDVIKYMKQMAAEPQKYQK